MWKFLLMGLARRWLFGFVMKNIVPEQEKLKKEFQEYKEKRAKVWEEENGKTIFRVYPMMSEYYASVAPVCKFFFVFFVTMFVAIMIFMFFYSVFDRGWNVTILDLRQMWETANWYQGVGLLLGFVAIGVFFYVPPLLSAYMKQTEVFFGGYGIGVFRFLRREKSATYEELSKYIKRHKICIKNGRYYIPCKGADISVSMIGGAFPDELFGILKRRCNVVLPDEDYKNRARISGLGWACGHLGGGILLFFAIMISLIAFVFEGEFTTMKLLHDLYVNPVIWASAAFVGIGFVCNLVIIPLTAWAYRRWYRVIRVSVLPLLIDALIVVLAFGLYINIGDWFTKHEMEERVQRETEIVQTFEQGFVRSFCRGVWGKEFEEVTPEEFAKVKYICVDYSDLGTTGVRYSMVDYKDCASEEEFQESVCIWQKKEDGVIVTPADISMFTGLTYVEISEYAEVSQSILPSENQITRMKIHESPKSLVGVVSPEHLEILEVEYYGETNEIEYLEPFSNLKQLSYCYRGEGEESDLAKLTCMESMEKLDLISTSGYVNLETLKYAKNLRSFSIDTATLQECDFVKDMKELQELSLCYSSDTDISILTGLPKLKSLRFNNNLVVSDTSVNLSQLASLDSLEELKITVKEREISDVVTLLKDRIKILNLTVITGGKLSYYKEESGCDLSVFAQMSKLKELDLNFENYTIAYGLDAITSMNQLTSFSLSGTIPFEPDIVLDTSKMSKNHSVNYLHFSRCVIRNPENEIVPTNEFLSCFKEVKHLSIPGDQDGISSYAFLKEFEELEHVKVEEFYLTESQRQELEEMEEKINVSYR